MAWNTTNLNELKTQRLYHKVTVLLHVFLDSLLHKSIENFYVMKSTPAHTCAALQSSIKLYPVPYDI